MSQSPVRSLLDYCSFEGAIAQVKIKGHSAIEVKPMAIGQLRYSKEEFARRGDEMYETQVRQQVEADNHGKIAAIADLVASRLGFLASTQH